MKDYCTITEGSHRDLNNLKNLDIGLKNILEEIDMYFGNGKETQDSYIKFMSKGDESDSADDEPEIPNFGKF